MNFDQFFTLNDPQCKMGLKTVQFVRRFVNPLIFHIMLCYVRRLPMRTLGAAVVVVLEYTFQIGFLITY